MDQQLEPRLVALSEAVHAITSELSLEQVLQKIAQAARTLINAKYAAMGVHDGRGTLSQFVTAGLDDETRAKIGEPPVGRGLLGVFLRQGESLIVNDMSQHMASVGFPAHHPPMKSLLGVPIKTKNRLIGALYLTDKQDGSPFTELDRTLVDMLAKHVAVAVENAELYDKTQRLAVLEERDRFARDLHDGIIQAIYAVGLSLDGVKASIAADNEPALAQIDSSLKSLADVISDLRNYIFDLRPQALSNKGLYARLQALLKELKVNSSFLSVQSQIEPDINDYVNATQASHIFHIAHEALSNAARHAQATIVKLRLEHIDQQIILEVEDNGQGFTPPTSIKLGHHGLENMQKRASLIGATLTFDSTSGEGTLVRLVLRSASLPVVVNKNLPFDAVIFDLDGTLIDTETPDYEASRRLYEAHGAALSPDEWASKTVGIRGSYRVTLVDLAELTGHSVHELEPQLRQFWQATLYEVKLMPGVHRLLAELTEAGYPLGLATASDRRWIKRWFTHFELDRYFAVTSSGVEVAHNKPAPDVYLQAAARLGVQPERCLVFEDSEVGVQAAKAAGMTVVAVPSHITKTLDFSLADRIINSLDVVRAATLADLITEQG